jgi:hypothetical protein
MKSKVENGVFESRLDSGYTQDQQGGKNDALPS